ncbi:hypothetical protein NCCP1664_02360 [Zafaria cholistanensis]|uniref:STAS/SEC14 domain-containing protein n=1 Tax=Zafaria cholistanensis TaxID=1682741 RepID=A0A5A7NMF7_9MICC|nr:STAS/SEC14 domain-containing protein [Zafaria cholistanensis]GER21739.1 hypothetical protein NCCP1664_02360 [Zafaria cholistanensis]
MASSTGTWTQGSGASDPAVLPAPEAAGPPAPSPPAPAPPAPAPSPLGPHSADSTASPDTTTFRPLPGGVLEVGFAPRTTLTARLVRQLSDAAAGSGSGQVPAHLLVHVSALDGVAPRASCVLGGFDGIGRIAFLGSGPADRVTARFMMSALPHGTEARYLEDRDEALHYLKRDA